MKGYITFIIRNRKTILGLVLFVTLGFAAIAAQGVYSSAIAKLFFGEDHPGFNRYRERIREFANDEMIIVIYKDPQMFSAESLARLESAVEQIEMLSEIRRVDSLLNAQHTFALRIRCLSTIMWMKLWKSRKTSIKCFRISATTPCIAA
jgi:predicted RND superfamily exporter protein